MKNVLMTARITVSARIINVSALTVISAKTVHFMNARITALNKDHVTANPVNALATPDSSETTARKNIARGIAQVKVLVNSPQVNAFVKMAMRKKIVQVKNARRIAQVMVFALRKDNVNAGMIS